MVDLPDLTCPGIDAAIAALEGVRNANSQMRYGYWHMQEEVAALRAELAQVKADARRQALRELEDMHERGWARESDRGNHDLSQWHREIAEHIRHMQIEAEQ